MGRISLIAAVAVLAASHSEAANLKLLVAGSMTEPFREVGVDFEKRTSHRLDFTFNTAGALQGQLRSGQKADVILVSAAVMDALQKDNLIEPASRIDLASASIGLAVRAGAPSPDLSTPGAFKAAILNAKSIAYVNPQAGGTSGVYLDGLFQRMGIAEEVKKKVVFGNQGWEIAAHVASGRAELGMTFTSEMIANKGVKIAGLLPAAIQNTTNYTVAIPVGSLNADVARAFIDAMKTSAAATSIAKAGLTPLAAKP